MTGKTYDVSRLCGYKAGNGMIAESNVTFTCPALSERTSHPLDNMMLFVRHGSANYNPLIVEPLDEGFHFRKVVQFNQHIGHVVWISS
jgi:hypothetical protein